MAEGAAPTAPLAPAQAFPNGDPRNAAYGENAAKLEHQLANFRTEYGRELGTARANTTYKQGLISQQEPTGYRNQTNRANTEGLAESGILARNRGTLQSQYANKRFALTQGLKEGEGRLARGLNKNEEALRERAQADAIKALEEGKGNLLKEPPAPEGGAVPGAAPRPATLGLPGALGGRIPTVVKTGQAAGYNPGVVKTGVMGPQYTRQAAARRIALLRKAGR